MFGEQMMMAAGGGLNVDDVFATTLFTNDSTPNRLIATPFDPFLAWIKSRVSTHPHLIMDAGRGNNYLTTTTTDAQLALGAGYGDVRSGGFYQAGAGSSVGWAFAKAPKFFDVQRVTIPAAGGNNFRIPHNLDAVPGFILAKRVVQSSSWLTFHRSRGKDKTLFFHASDGELSVLNVWGATAPTATDFGVDVSSFGASDWQFILFAHDPELDGVIHCGQFTGDTFVPLPWEPQFLIAKRADSAGAWIMLDIKRGWNAGSDQRIYGNLQNPEDPFQMGGPTTTGFTTANFSGEHIFIAIRRGTL